MYVLKGNSSDFAHQSVISSGKGLIMPLMALEGAVQSLMNVVR